MWRRIISSDEDASARMQSIPFPQPHSGRASGQLHKSDRPSSCTSVPSSASLSRALSVEGFSARRTLSHQDAFGLNAAQASSHQSPLTAAPTGPTKRPLAPTSKAPVSSLITAPVAFDSDRTKRRRLHSFPPPPTTRVRSYTSAACLLATETKSTTQITPHTPAADKMVAMGETITVVNKSGKIVSTSKHLVNIFNEAKSAYNERKAELRAFRKGEVEKKDDERGARTRLEALTLDDGASTSRRRSRRNHSDDSRTKKTAHGSERRRERPPMERGVSDSFYVNDSGHQRSSQPSSPLRQEVERDIRVGELARRHTDNDLLDQRSRRPQPRARSASLDDIDMDLAYGELPPPLPERRYDEEIELRAKMSGLQRLLDECNCLQHSVTAIIDNLQKNPDSLAAVALTLAEISNLVAKMAPGALTALKGSFPAAVALLASPEFAIAAGAAVGVTIVVLGGYKIIKKIQGKKAEEAQLLQAGDAKKSGVSESDMESLREIDRIEVWRRGIANVEAESLGSTVDGELITPRAAKTLIQDGRLTEADLKSRSGTSSHSKRKKKHRSSSDDVENRSSRSSRSRPEIRVKPRKEPSGIRMLFKMKDRTQG